ncbi:MFS transporter [Thermoanaerobacter sp. A7A]|uniref:MFS transporter n=1 Tax=Thermoanaerobacter sp. A7A TaxID=1350366 RepID=UPI0003FF581C|nr:MFS transporter [Thermoanaerobacter sp. A7A]
MSFFQFKLIYNKNLIIIYLLFFAFFFVVDSFETLLPLYLKEVKMNATILGTIVFLANLLRTVSSTPIGHLGDTIGYKRLVLFIFLLLIVAFLCLAIFKIHITIFLLSVLILASKTPFNITLNPMLALMVESNKRGSAFGVRDIFLYSGITLGMLVAGLLTQYGFHIVFLANGILLLLMLPLVFILKESKVSEKAEDIKQKSKFWAQLREIKNKKVLKVFSVIVFLTSFASGTLVFIPLKGSEIGIADNFILYTFAGSSFLAAILSYVGGRITDLFNRKNLFLVNLVFTLILYVFLYLSSSITAFVISILLYTTILVFAPIYPVYFFDCFSEQDAGKAWGIVSTFSLVAEMIAPLIWGAIWDTSSQGMIFIFAGLFVIFAIILSLIYLPPNAVALKFIGMWKIN